VTDGDTVRITTPLLGTTRIRLVNIDAPELNGGTQEPWAGASRDALGVLLPAGTMVQILTDRDPLDSFGRVLGVIIRQGGLDVNREQIRAGHAVTYFIWPNADRFIQYRQAQIEAQDAGRGIWATSGPLRELPFEYRLRIDNERPFRPVGDALTRRFVEPADYRQVHVNNRVFFGTALDARSAGYDACPREETGYSALCFAAGH
jgi:endonuclease YncB( thermonuclease family)